MSCARPEKARSWWAWTSANHPPYMNTHKGTYAPLLRQWNACEAACTAASFDCTQERRTSDDITLDPYHHHRFRTSLGGFSHLQRKEIDSIPHERILSSRAWQRTGQTMRAGSAASSNIAARCLPENSSAEKQDELRGCNVLCQCF